jgi:DNA polymerase I
VFDEFREVWAADFEFVAQPGCRPEPVCMVARELRSGRTIKLWRGEFVPVPPFPVGDDTLFVAYYASAELGCFRALGWPMPARILDLFTEFRAHLNYVQAAKEYRRSKAQGFGLIDALTHFGLDNIGATEKRSMIDIILRGPPWTEQERAVILDYCESDVVALARRFPALAPHIDLPRALLRGRYMAAASAIEYTGVPIDVEMLDAAAPTTQPAFSRAPPIATAGALNNAPKRLDKRISNPLASENALRINGLRGYVATCCIYSVLGVGL